MEYNEKQVIEAGLSYFNDTLASDVWVKKYALKDKDKWVEGSPRETLTRIIDEVYRIEENYKKQGISSVSYKEIENAIQDFKYFVPAGSILFGCGNNYQVSSLGNCFFINNGSDSYGGIFNTDESMVQLMKRRGGVGITLEHLRPSMANVNNAAQTSTGAASFMHRFSNSTREVAQDGRRGAAMISMAIEHPDIVSFIMAKDDLTKVTGANISVKVSDEFMKAVESGSDYILRWPVTTKVDNKELLVYNKLYKKDDGTYVKRIKAKELWEIIVKQAHKNAEPGLLFWDTIIRESPADCYSAQGFETQGVNPCITGDTLVVVADGRGEVRIDQLAKEENDVPVYCLDDRENINIQLMRNPRITGYNQPIYKITFDGGDYMRVTGNHKIRMKSGEYKEAKDLLYGDSIHISNINHNIINNNNKINNDIDLNFIDNMELSKCYHSAINSGYNTKIDNNKVMVAKNCETCDIEFWIPYTSREISFCSIDCADLFVKPTYTSHDNLNNENCKIISVELDGTDTVYNGTVDKYHNFFTSLKQFDKINQTKQFIINNLNCGEIPIGDKDSCRLGSINLNNLVLNPYTPDAKVDWGMLGKISRLSQRIMDNILILEEGKISTIISKIEDDPEDPEIKRTELNLWKGILDVLRKGRRTGIGVIGLADMFAKMNLVYGTVEATSFAEEIFKTIAINCYKESVKLAKERGAFSVWNADLEALNPFKIRIIGENFSNKEYDEYLKYGRRNIASLSIAPTGSISCLGKTSSGIEPVFSLYYKRRRKINSNELNTKVDFVDELGDSWQEYRVFHPEFINWAYTLQDSLNLSDKQLSIGEIRIKLENLPEKELKEIADKSPWKKSQSHDIDYLEKLNMQGMIQKYVDHSISVTTNLPNNISVDEVNKIYFHAWRTGCKGITIYREGSRSGVLITENNENKIDEEFKTVNAPKRPKELLADYYVSSALGKKYAVVVGLWPNTKKPYEIFAFENPPLDKNTTGKIVKIRKGHYKFINGEFEIENLELATDQIQQRAHTILMSMLLRHGAPIEHVVAVSKKIDENITSFSSVCRRILSRYITTKNDLEKCPECNSTLIREEGCIRCESCSFSKCG